MMSMIVLILVGIGYKNFVQMDSLRDRDHTFPAAMPKYQMKTTGGGVNNGKIKSHCKSGFRV